jgi:shikimate kinase
MGAGKSTVGKRLARELGKRFVDLDEAFEAKFRYSIPRFFDHFGELRFREFEKQCLHDIIEKEDDVVISTGGGTACFHDNIDLMNRNGITVYLKMHPKSIAHRLNRARRLRPVVRDINNDGMQKFVEEQLAERETFYNQALLIVKGESLDMNILKEMIDGYDT